MYLGRQGRYGEEGRIWVVVTDTTGTVIVLGRFAGPYSASCCMEVNQTDKTRFICLEADKKI